MKEKKMVTMSLPKEGEFQMLNGNIGSLANEVSQRAKPPKLRADRIIRVIMYGVFHPTAGAWLEKHRSNVCENL